MSLLFLALSAAFFLVEDFRWALELPLALTYEETSKFHFLDEIPVGQFASYRASAEQHGDAPALAFVAMHLEGDREASFRLAEQAVSRDPKLTWVLYHVLNRFRAVKEPALAQRFQKWVRLLKEADPDNALPYLLQAEILREQDPKWPSGTPAYSAAAQGWPYLKSLAAKTEWRTGMEQAFACPRYDSYLIKRFELERRVLREQGWASPPVMIMSMASYPIPSLLNIREYAQLEAKQLASDDVVAQRGDQAVHRYWQTMNFGQMLHLNGVTLIEKLIGVAAEQIGAEPLRLALIQQGKKDEARLLDLRIAALKQGGGVIPGNDPLAASSVLFWTGRLFYILVFQTYAFAALTLLAILYVNLKSWVRPQVRGGLYQVVTVAENYLPVLLFVSCVALDLIYAPFASNFRHYLVATGEIKNIEPLWYNVFPAPWAVPSYLNLPMGNLFQPYAPWAAAGFALVVLWAALEEWRARQQAAIRSRS